MTTGLNIAALAQRTGVAPDTLRKWEQRYAILQPERTAGGQRRYSERDVARVEWLRERLEEGYRIGEAASLLGSLGSTPPRAAREHLKGLLDALDDLEAEAIGLRLDQAFALLHVEETFESVLVPLLQAVGERWRNGTMTTAEEHLISEAVRSRLGHLLERHVVLHDPIFVPLRAQRSSAGIANDADDFATGSGVRGIAVIGRRKCA